MLSSNNVIIAFLDVNKNKGVADMAPLSRSQNIHDLTT